MSDGVAELGFLGSALERMRDACLEGGLSGCLFLLVYNLLLAWICLYLVLE